MSSLARYLDPEVIQQVSRLDLRARFIVEGFLAGLHSSPFHGFSVEFSEHRKYVKGDDPRTIDWSVFARTDRLYVRKYQAETHLACHLIVDASASMGYVGALGGGEPERRSRLGRARREPPSPQPAGKLMYVVHLAAALGYLITRQQDAVGLYVVGDGLEQMLPPRSRRADLVQMVSTLSSIVPRGRTGLARGIHEALARISHRGIVVVLSDLLTDAEELIEALHHIRFRGHDLIVMHVLDAGEAHFPFQGSVRLEDPESGESLVADADAVRQRYLDGLHEWREKLRRAIEAARGDYLPLDTSTPFDKALVEFLTQRQRRR
ncbi:MAG: DUF58 domain-containing protein [Planctomycetes bacterium]|nr:DUF58 domain-containing protein [Planctomycetota bacterium]